MATRWKKLGYLNGADPAQQFALDCDMSKQEKNLYCAKPLRFCYNLCYKCSLLQYLNYSE